MAATSENAAANVSSGNSVLTVGGMATALGSLGVIVTTAFYALSPPAAAMPKQPFELITALEGTVAGAATMLAASTVGIFADVILAVGVLLVALEFARRDRGVATAGWLTIFLGVVIFIFVDAIVGHVLVPLAVTQAGAGAFAGFKYLFDTLFLLGTITFGAGAVLALGSECRAASPLMSRPLAYIGIVIGLFGIAAAIACFAHLPLELAVGASIGLGSVLFMVIGVQLARRA
jgi:hypothetical protein